MSDKKSPCCPDKVAQLIANADSKFTAEDADFLNTLSAEQLEKVQPTVVEKVKEVEKIVIQKEDLTKEAALTVLSEHFSDPAKFLALLPKEMRDQMESGLKLHKERRDGMITSIVANQSGDVWKKEELETMDMVMLDKIYRSLPIKRDFTVQSGHVGANANTEVEALLPPGVK